MGVLKSSAPTASVLRALRVSLNSQGVSWINEFLDLGGLDLLIQSLEAIDYKQYTTLLLYLFFLFSPFFYLFFH